MFIKKEEDEKNLPLREQIRREIEREFQDRTRRELDEKEREKLREIIEDKKRVA